VLFLEKIGLLSDAEVPAAILNEHWFLTEIRIDDHWPDALSANQNSIEIELGALLKDLLVEVPSDFDEPDALNDQ
jgi:hypothetical protein